VGTVVLCYHSLITSHILCASDVCVCVYVCVYVCVCEQTNQPNKIKSAHIEANSSFRQHISSRVDAILQQHKGVCVCIYGVLVHVCVCVCTVCSFVCVDIMYDEVVVF